MLIGIDGSRAFIKNKTGTENYSYQLLKYLAKTDKNNRYIIYLRPGSEVGSDWPENFKFKVINFPRLWTQIGLALQTFIDPLDILFVPAHTLPLIRKPGLKTVMTIHDLGAEYLPKTHQLKQRAYLGFITKFQLNSATKLIAVSENTKKDLIKKIGIEPQKIAVIYEGFNKELFKLLKTDALIDRLTKYDLKKEQYFLFVGTIQPRKNLERLIEAYDSFYGPFDEVPKLILVGAKGWLSEEIYKLVKTLDLKEKIKFLGRVDDQDLAALYQGAIALVYPSLYEGFGLPVLEAYASNTPAMVSQTSSLPEVAGEGAVYVDPLDINSIAGGMEKFLIRQKDEAQMDKNYNKYAKFKLNKKFRDNMVKKAQDQLKKFSWEKAAEETLNLFKNL